MVTFSAHTPSPFSQTSIRPYPQKSLPQFGNTQQLPKKTQQRINNMEQYAKKEITRRAFGTSKAGERRDSGHILQSTLLTILSSLHSTDELLKKKGLNQEVRKALQSIHDTSEELLKSISVAKELASRHHLTFLRDEPSYKTALNKAIKKTQKHETPFTVAMVDIDYFKDVNDNKNYGSHTTGDIALKAVGQALQEALGTEGEAFHLHGEEFTLLIPGKTLDEAKELLIKVSETVYNLRTNTDHFHREEDKPLFEVFSHRPLALSIGAMEITPDALTQIDPTQKNPKKVFKAIKEFPDTAMYAAKDNGRNQIQKITLKTEGNQLVIQPELLHKGEVFQYPSRTVGLTSGYDIKSSLKWCKDFVLNFLTWSRN